MCSPRSTRSATIRGSGDGEVSYRWEFKEPGGEWRSFFTRTITMNDGRASVPPFESDVPHPNGDHQFRISVSEPNDKTSNVATLVVTEPTQILGAYGRGLALNQPGKVKIDVHAASDGVYYVKVFNKGAIPGLKWDWVSDRSSTRSLSAGSDSSFTLTTTPDSPVANFEVWLYRQTAVPGVFWVVDKRSFRLSSGMIPSVQRGDFYFSPGHPAAAREIPLDERIPIILVHGMGIGSNVTIA